MFPSNPVATGPVAFVDNAATGCGVAGGGGPGGVEYVKPVPAVELKPELRVMLLLGSAIKARIIGIFVVLDVCETRTLVKYVLTLNFHMDQPKRMGF